MTARAQHSPEPPWTPADGLYLHSGHSHLISWLTAAGAADRWRVITREKPEPERELRARLFRPVPARAELAAARAEYVAARAELAAADAEYVAAWDEYVAARAELAAGRVRRRRARAEYAAARAKYFAAARAELAAYTPAMHAADCPGCPWDGRTIFPERAP